MTFEEQVLLALTRVLQDKTKHLRNPGSVPPPTKRDEHVDRYEKPFDETRHPRVPAGTPDGGQFVEANNPLENAPPVHSHHVATEELDAKLPAAIAPKDASSSTGEARKSRAFVVPKKLQPYAVQQRADYEQADQLTTAELQKAMHAWTDELSAATDREDREDQDYAALWLHRIHHVLEQRDYSDDNAPLAAKQRRWDAQRNYGQLHAQQRVLENWLAQSQRTIWKTTASINDARNKLAATKRQLADAASVLGATPPRDNPIRNWAFEQKLAAAMDRVAKSDRLAPEIVRQLEQALEPQSLLRTGAAMATLAALHTVPLAGLAADTALLAYAGTDGAILAYRLYHEISSIQDESDLESVAKVLEQELAAQAAGKLLDLLTWGAVKGTAKFNKHYDIQFDHDKVRRLSTGTMPLSANPGDIVPIKIVPKNKQTAKTTEVQPKPKRKEVGKAANSVDAGRITDSTLRPGFNEPWVAPKHWNGPQKHGSWSGPGSRGNTSWIDERPEIIRIVGTNPRTGKANPIDFHTGHVDFSKWKQAEFEVLGLNGNHTIDQPLMRKKFAELSGWFKKDGVTPDESRVLNFLRDADDGFGGRGLRLHHAGGDVVQLIPKDLHKLQHTDMTH